jgi:hypothetical protein
MKKICFLLLALTGISGMSAYGAYQMPEMIVTARKEAEPIQEEPKSWEVITKEDM